MDGGIGYGMFFFHFFVTLFFSLTVVLSPFPLPLTLFISLYFV